MEIWIKCFCFFSILRNKIIDIARAKNLILKADGISDHTVSIFEQILNFLFYFVFILNVVLFFLFFYSSVELTFNRVKCTDLVRFR